MGKPLDHVSETPKCSRKLNDCSKAALLKVQQEQQGRGIICADEVSQFLTGMLKRSHSDSSGERQLLLTLWGGRGHSVAYASKSDVSVMESGLCTGGFTQPDRMFEIMDDMKTSGDGLFERFLFWMLPGYIYSGKKIREASESFAKENLLQNLDPVFQEIFSSHDVEDPIIYSFSPESQEYMEDVEDNVKPGLRESAATVVFDSDDYGTP